MNVGGTPRVVVGGIKKECCAARMWKIHSNDVVGHPLKEIDVR